MALIYVMSYQHHDEALLAPVAQQLAMRGHNILSAPHGFQAFLETFGPRALLLVSDLSTFGHSPGQAVVKQCRDTGIPSISMQHGAPFWHTGHKSNADIYCFWGKAWVDMIETYRTAVTGNPRMDKIPQLSSVDKWGGAKKALLIPAIRPDCDIEELGEIGPDAALRASYYIEKARQQEWDGNWLVRPHPSDLKYPDRMAAYDYIVQSLPATLQLPNEEPLYRVFNSVDMVFGTSTAVVEALPFGCEVRTIHMPLLPELDVEAMFGAQDYKAAERVANVVEKAIIDRMNSVL